MVELQFEQHREHIESLVTAALAAADSASAVRRHLKVEGRSLQIGAYRYDLNRGRIFLISTGKAALTMGRAALEQLGSNVAGGVVIGKRAPDSPPRAYSAVLAGQSTVTIYEAGHPISDESSLEATEAVISLLEQTQEDDLVLCLISGGTSSLLTKPIISLPHWQWLNEALLESGSTINELNCVRKQLDLVKGGGLAALAAPAATISLILSDVVGNHLDIIGSGPTVPDSQSPAEALTVLHRYRMADALPVEVWERITDHLTDERTAASLARFEELELAHVLVGDVRQAATAAVRQAELMGFDAHLLTAHLEGEAREVGKVVAALARDTAPGRCLVLGGETTVSVHGSGRGGRNQELALAAAIALVGARNVVIASFATDGEDGTTGAAGALVNGKTAGTASEAGLSPRSYLDNNDSHGFFRQFETATGQSLLLKTGPTGTNVNDLVLILSY